MRKKLKILVIIGTVFITTVNIAQAQSLRKKAEQIRSSIEELDLDKIIVLYADTVRYIDPNFGSDDRFSRATIREFFAPMFQAGSTADLKIHTAAVDEKEGSVIIRGSSYDTTEKGRLPFLVYFKFENGKIVKQMDFPVYSVESLRNAPRYKGYFKEKEGN
ncbi:MAG: nuclear transport factor 2 family protein [Roseivirga sp.]|nr:nuclear transport factor 2 family protein [Roseivirga sp.]